MIPNWTHSGVLPPFTGQSPTSKASCSPYIASASDVVKRFGNSIPRIDILRGWLNYRAELTKLGFVTGYQWLDGSFVEDAESET